MEGREVEATPDAVIGREGTDIVLADPEVSRRHAAIRVQAGGVAIEDLGSTNGTFVNDRRIQGLQSLSNGDSVRLGNTVWRLRVTAAAGATNVGPAQPPQVTAARPVPTDIGPPAAPPTAPQPAAQPAPPAPPQAPAQPGAPSPAVVGPRGDVPAPPEVAPSAIRRVLPPPAAGQATAFTPPASRSRGGSVATRLEATVVCLLIVLAVAVAVAVYFASQA
jgi:predicted component of type VI protein secretion system